MSLPNSSWPAPSSSSTKPASGSVSASQNDGQHNRMMMKKTTTTSEALIEATLATNPQEHLTDVRIGLGYTAIQLSSGHCGLACLLRHKLDQDTCSLLDHAGTLTGMKASHAVPLLRTPNVVTASVGLATINALAAKHLPPPPSDDPPLSDLLHLTPDDRIAMIGHIEPIIQHIKPRVTHLWVFDEAKTHMPGIIPLHRQPELLPQCTVAILSATSILNHTIDALFAMTTQAREICLMGPSTPLIPAVFQPRGVTLLAGRQITNASKLLQVVSEAGGTRRFKKITKKVNIVLTPEPKKT
ncbi:hypothetical protein GF339_16880 [candidate division KSB3 bacterium]|uniref:Heavy-metal chelation domain-containing protein n=1 Tax=candidate division KSB3 bacterium TaxID=2044937 RepID=A0A9D5Q7B2_9BACT|nr:hypothetical protein [candidate division KSB3 bacterium]MBD3326263.1 hypothetical protein [candidate division KSB3 bacterium]